MTSDKPVNVYFRSFGNTARDIRVRWWIDTIHDENDMLDQVNAALESALDEAGIDMPFPTYDLNLKMEGEDGSRVNQALSDESAKQSGNEE